MKRLLAVAVALLLTGCADGGAFRMSGMVSVYPGVVRGEIGDPCEMNREGMEDVREGAQVTITDESGAVVALATLSPGKIAETTGAAGSRIAVSCDFGFFADVPDREFYGVEVTHRGPVRFAREDADYVRLTLG